MSRFMNKLNEAKNIKKSQKKLNLEGQKAFFKVIWESPIIRIFIWTNHKMQ